MNSIVNDFSIQVATVNGSGSQSANLILMRSIFSMGVPVSGKNLFPSNIAGLPTWYTIRANRDGWVARKKEIDLLIAMNPGTVAEDLESLPPGAWVILNDALPAATARTDLQIYKVPFTKLVSEVVKEMKLRKLVVNMIYVGVVTELLGVDAAVVEAAVDQQFKGKAKAAALNKQAVEIGRRYARDNPSPIPFRVERMEATRGKIIIDGNAAGALGAVFGGLSVLAWYPITPSSSLCESAIDYLGRFRHDAEGRATYAVVQAEDELASIGMVIGASWAGARAMTATAGPGISLMAEFVGLGYYAEIPAVIWDIQRTGPSTGLPTRTCQGDIRFVAGLSHGDTRHLVLLPASVDECYTMAMDAFDLAERFQTPVFVLSDLDIGMNNWMSDPFPHVDRPFDRGKVLSAEDLERAGRFERYRDLDGDGICARTLPGTDHPLAAYFTRGSGHNEAAQYSEKPQDYVDVMDRLARKYETAREHVPAPVIAGDEDAEVGIVAFGSSHHAVEEARDQLLREAGLATRYLRLRALPMNGDVKAFVDSCERVYVVEQNRDAQMAALLKLHCGDVAHKTRSVLHYDGLPLDARSVSDEILKHERIEVNRA